jgi:predicted permease
MHRMTALRILDVVRQDARYGWRALVRSPAFTITAVTSLALGIGANTAVFGLLYAVLLEPLPLPRPDRLVVVQRSVENSRFAPLRVGAFSAAEMAQLERAQGVRLAVTAGMSGVRIEAASQRDVSNVDLVDGALFPTLGLVATAGRVITPDDDRAAQPVLVVSELLAERWFGSARDAIGKVVTLNEASYTIVGVAPRAWHGITFPGSFSIAAPITTAPMLGVPDPRGARAGATIVVGRLADGTTRGGASAAIAAQFQQCCAHGELAIQGGNVPPGLSKTSLVDISHGVAFGKMDLRAEYGRTLLILMAGVALVLLIACANVGNLLLARSAARTRELAVRLSLGASRARLVRQLLTESAQLAIMGGALGVALAAWWTGALVRSLPGNLTFLANVIAFRPKPVLLSFTVGVSVMCVLVFGLVPALRATRTDLVTPLKEGGDSRSGGPAGWLDRSLVVAQVALALLLMSSAGLLATTLRNLRQVDGGFATTHVLMATVDTRGTSREREGAIPMHAELLDRVRRIPGIQMAAMSMNTPVYGGRSRSAPLAVPGDDSQGGDETAMLNPVTTGYFAASGIVLRSGRDFNAADAVGAPKVAVISEGIADRYFRGRDPVGHVIRMGADSAVLMTVVGVARDAKYLNLRGGADPLVYVPIAQAGAGGWPFVVITARTTGEPSAAAVQLRREILAFGPDLRVQRPQPMEEAMDVALARERLAAALAGVFGMLALGLAAVGLYGVVSYNVTRRTVEIGVRMALGARARDVVWHVLRGSLTLVGLGVLIGAPLTFAGGKVVAALLFGIGAHDPLMLVAAALALGGVAIVAGAIPAARAARIDPLRALRQG